MTRPRVAWPSSLADLPTRAGVLPLSSRPVVMGIVNVTPDSFSDGGQHATERAAIAHAQLLLEQGADILDIGGESTRPGAEPVPADLELARVLPVIEAMAAQGAIVSVDTTKASVAVAAVAAGAAIVNDVSAGHRDPEMLSAVAELAVAYVAMHARGTPRDMQDDPQYDDVVRDVLAHLADAIARAKLAGIDEDRIILDPGIGFGKTPRHNLTLLRDLVEFRALGRPVLVGASRKAFLGVVSGIADPAQRLAPSLAAALLAVEAGAAIVRVHDVAATVAALRVASAVRMGEPLLWAPIGPAASTDKERA